MVKWFGVKVVQDKTDVYPYRRRLRAEENPGNPAREETRRHFSFKLGERIARLIRVNLDRTAVVLGLIACVVARGTLLGELTPFGMAILAAIMASYPGKIVLPLLGAMIGSLTASSGLNLWSGLTGLVVLMAVLQSLPPFYPRRWILIPTAVLITNAAVKGIYLYFYHPTVYSAVSVGVESMAAAVLTLVGMVAFNSLERHKRREGLNPEEIVAWTLLGLILLLGLSTWKVAGVSVARVITNTGIMLAALTGGSGLAAGVGVITGFLPSINGVVAPAAAGTYALAGLLAGMFRVFNKLGVIAGFTLANLLFSAYFLDHQSVTTDLTETGLSALLLLLVPAWSIRWFRSHLAPVVTRPVTGEYESRLRDLMSGKIRNLARVFNELARTFEQVASQAQTEEQNVMASLFNNISTRVCDKCSIYKVCWQKDFQKTYLNVMEVLKIAESKGGVRVEDITPDLTRRCIRLKDLATTLNYLYETYRVNHYWQKRVEECRSLLPSQLKGVSGIMSNLANELKLEVEFKEDLEYDLGRELKRQGLQIEQVNVIRNASGVYEVEITKSPCQGQLECVSSVAGTVTRMMGRPFCVDHGGCLWKAGDERCVLKLFPGWAYTVTTGVAQAARETGVVNGDTCSTLLVPDGRQALIISDGMGTGSRAAAESQAAISLLEQLLASGFEKDLAVRTVNTILVLHSPEENFATIDLALLDLYTGETDFIKIGAAPSFLKRNGQISVIAANSLPAGILNHIEVVSQAQQLRQGDILVMISDGMLEQHRATGEVDWMVELLSKLATDDPQIIAEMLLERAKAGYRSKTRDDITVLVARVDSRLH